MQKTLWQTSDWLWPCWSHAQVRRGHRESPAPTPFWSILSGWRWGSAGVSHSGASCCPSALCCQWSWTGSDCCPTYDRSHSSGHAKFSAIHCEFCCEISAEPGLFSRLWVGRARRSFFFLVRQVFAIDCYYLDWASKADRLRQLIFGVFADVELLLVPY